MLRVPEWVRRIFGDVVTLWFCVRHPRSPVSVKILAGIVVVYALSPIDLIPDFIMIFGLLDDAVLLPAGVWLILKLVPPDVLAECREQSARWIGERKQKPPSRLGMVLVIATGLAALSLVSWLAWRWLGN